MIRSRWSTAVRLSIGLTGVTVSLVFGACLFGFVPDTEGVVLEGRKRLCETIAVQCAVAAERGDVAPIRAVVRALVQRHPDVLSTGVRTAAGELLVEAGNHKANWEPLPNNRSTATQWQVPVLRGEEPWGKIEIQFRPAEADGILGWLGIPGVGLALFLGLVGLAAYTLYLFAASRQFDPVAVIPERVKAVLDTMSEGVLVLDEKERIVLANKVFANILGVSTERLLGRRASALPWKEPGSNEPAEETPWTRVIREGTSQQGVALGLGTASKEVRSLAVNAAPIVGARGEQRGALVTVDDVTATEQMNAHLQEMLADLKKSSDKITRQNRELEILATHDPLTSCLNRRSFFDRFDTIWAETKRYRHPLSCLMIDIDHFKRINDDHGHTTGDRALRRVADVLKSGLRQSDVICRYGGEEFSILLTHTDLDDAAETAERLRSAIEEADCGGVSLAVSIGVSSVCLGPGQPDALADQADKALYVAKRRGRNRVVRFDEIGEEAAEGASQDSAITPHEGDSLDTPIPWPAVNSLMAALGHRDMDTVAHARRVADWCLVTARGLMSASDCYVLEVAAMLHDIGKIGVPDAILLKPGPLNEDEWKVMREHDTMGIDIVSAALASPELTTTIRNCHCWYGGSSHDPSLPKGEDIPLSARILTIADAFDAMTITRAYRRAKSQEEAFVELRRCSGTQFDPDMVERFIEVVSARKGTAPTISERTAGQVGHLVDCLAGR